MLCDDLQVSVAYQLNCRSYAKGKVNEKSKNTSVSVLFCSVSWTEFSVSSSTMMTDVYFISRKERFILLISVKNKYILLQGVVNQNVKVNISHPLQSHCRHFISSFKFLFY